MLTAVTLVLAMMGAGLMVSIPPAGFVCFVAAYLVGRKVTLADVEGFLGTLFLLAIVGAVATPFF